MKVMVLLNGGLSIVVVRRVGAVERTQSGRHMHLGFSYLARG